MKNKIQIICLALITLTLPLITHNSYSQNVGINSDGANGDSNTMLDIKATDNTSSTFGLKVKDAAGDAKMVVRSDGNVGIGTTSPGYKLDVQGSGNLITQIRGTNTQGTFIHLENSNSVNSWNIAAGGSSGWNDNSFVIDEHGSSARLTIKPGGNVGIGTISPGYMLDVQGTSNLITQIRGTDSQGTFLHLENSNSSNSWNIAAGGNSGWDNNSFVIDEHGVSPRVTVKPGGNVGVGTVSPVSRLDVISSSGRSFTVGEESTPNRWLDLSSHGGGIGLYAGNAYLNQSDNSHYFSQTHAQIGATGFEVNGPGWNRAGIFVNDGGSTAATQFTPNWIAVFSPTGVGLGANNNNPNATLDINGTVAQNVVTIAANDATPDVSGGNILVTTANTGATAITDLDNPVTGQTIRIIGGSNTNPSTIADAGNFNLSAPWTANLDDVLILFVQADNDYIEIGRVNN